MNMDTIRAFAAEDREAAEHRSRVADQRQKALLSWDYSNLRIDALVAPMSALTNVLGLLLAVALGGGRHGVEAIIVVDASAYCSRPGPRLVDGVEILAAALHPGQLPPPPAGTAVRLAPRQYR